VSPNLSTLGSFSSPPGKSFGQFYANFNQENLSTTSFLGPTGQMRLDITETPEPALTFPACIGLGLLCIALRWRYRRRYTSEAREALE
jgi:hypothetical protein